MEVVLVVRFGRPGGWAASQPPLEVWAPLLAFAVLGLSYLRLRIGRIGRENTQIQAKAEGPSWSEASLLYAAVVPLAMLLKQWNWSSGEKQWE
jgi:hypothetical protein